MIHTLTRMAITFQSTNRNASTSVMIPAHTMIATPSRAATAGSMTLVRTAMIASEKMMRVSHAMGSIGSAYVSIRYRERLAEADRALGFVVC